MTRASTCIAMYKKRYLSVGFSRNGVTVTSRKRACIGIQTSRTTLERQRSRSSAHTMNEDFANLVVIVTTGTAWVTKFASIMLLAFVHWVLTATLPMLKIWLLPRIFHWTKWQTFLLMKIGWMANCILLLGGFLRTPGLRGTTIRLYATTAGSSGTSQHTVRRRKSLRTRSFKSCRLTQRILLAIPESSVFTANKRDTMRTTAQKSLCALTPTSKDRTGRL